MPVITPLDFEEEICKFRGQDLRLPPINQANCYEKVLIKEGNHESLKLPDISKTAKRRKPSRRKPKKKAKKDKDSSSEAKKVKKKKLPPIRRMPGEITKSLSIVSSASGSKYFLIQSLRQSPSRSMDNSECPETDF